MLANRYRDYIICRRWSVWVVNKSGEEEVKNYFDTEEDAIAFVRSMYYQKTSYH